MLKPSRSRFPPGLRTLCLFLGGAGFWACRSPDAPLRFSASLAPSASARDRAAPEGHAGPPSLAAPGGAHPFSARFRFAGPLSEGLAPVLVGSRWGYADARGELVIPAAFAWAGPFREGRAAVADSGAYRFIDTAGAAVGTLVFADARPFSEGLAAVRFGDPEEGAWGFIDRRGDLAIPPAFADVPRGFSGGYAVVTVGREGGPSFGYIDTSGGFAMDTLFDAAGDFSEGLAPVGRGILSGGRFRGSWSYVDAAGARAFPGEWEWAGGFDGGRALVRARGGAFAYIDRRGAPAGAPAAGTLPAESRDGPRVTYMIRTLGDASRLSGRAPGPR